MASPPQWAGRGATRRRAAPRSESSRCAGRATPGIRAGSGPSCGISSTPSSRPARPCESFRCRTGPVDIWDYISAQDVPVVPLYFAAERPVVRRDGMLILMDDERLPLAADEQPVNKMVRFRSLGCYPLTAAIESDATPLNAMMPELRDSPRSERAGRLIDMDETSSMERKKREGYF